MILDAIIIGAGAAGIGVGVALKHAGIENFTILDRFEVGASFRRWPAETRFITPSFPTNSIGMLDLNSVAIGVSPAFSLGVEHPNGQEYAAHLAGVAEFFSLPVRAGVNVLQTTRVGAHFRVDTEDETLRCKHLIWAAGEFQYPRINAFPGSELCRHTATIPCYRDLQGADFVIIGGYESGIDAAYHLAKRGKRVRLFDRGCPWNEESSDPSIALSTYSLERIRDEQFRARVALHPNCSIGSVALKKNCYELFKPDGSILKTKTQPLLAAGFQGSHRLVSDLFERREDGYPLLNERDESTIASGLFLCGPAVRHEKHVFCFIYKYRQRFAVVAKAVATSLGLSAEELELYRKWGMYLDDLSCCGEECVC